MRILSSISLSCLLFLAPSTMSRFFISSSWGFSSATRIPSSRSCSPSGVIMKLSRVTLTAISGLKCGLRSSVTMYSLKSRWYSTTWSPSRMHSAPLCWKVCRRRTGSSPGSSSHCTSSSRAGRPDSMADCRLDT